MIAVFVNCAAVIIGSLVGLLFARKITDKFSSVVQTGAGIVVIIIGLQMAFKYQNIVCLALSLIIGGLLGTWWNIDGQILKLGNYLSRLTFGRRNGGIDSDRRVSNENWDFAYAFLNSSVLFCVGAMSILGSLQAGINKDYSIIFTKSILDGFMAVVFAAAMGPGTAFSSLTVLVYQGALTLLSTIVKPYLTELMISELTATGGALIVMIGINLLGLKKINTANYLPAIVLAILFVLFISAIK